MNMQNMDSLHKALAELRDDLPSDHYFSGVLTEFHSRQRNQKLAVKSFSARLTDSLNDLWFFNPGRLFQVSAFSLVILFFTLNGLHDAWNSNSSSLVNWYQGKPAAMEHSSLPESFLTSNGIDQLGSAALARPMELASLSLGEIGIDRTQYLMNSTPAAYDSVVAF